jgi:hypothetical protein
LSIFDTFNTSPASFILTITDRRRCRSIPTYCCSRTRSPPLLDGLGFATPSFVLLGDLREEDFAVLTDPDLTADFVGNAELLPNGNQPASLPRRSAETPHALLHDIKSRAVLRRF